MKGDGGIVTATIEITRAATGQVETYEVIGRVTQEQAEQLGLVEQEEERGEEA